MKLLIVTQAIDVDHPILGFFHRWVEEFAKHYDHVHVICLEAGKHSLPANVTVHSLGKEAGKGRLTYLFRFYQLIWRLRHEYDGVFVHMNQIYVILGAPFWRAVGKRIGLWYTHGTVSISLKIATFLTNHVFTASSESFKIATANKRVTGHGIDTTIFKPAHIPKTIDLITVGRLSPVKDIESLLTVLALLRQNHAVTLTVVGTAIDEAGRRYQQQLQEQCEVLGLTTAVTWHGAASQSELARQLNQAKVFVTASKTGSLDKVVLEAMACGIPIVSSASGTQSLPLSNCQVTTRDEFARVVREVVESSNYQRPDYVSHVVGQHSLSNLITTIKKHYDA